MKEENKIEALKQLLLASDLEKIDQTDNRLNEVVNDLYTREHLEKLINPLIDDKLNTFQNEIPEKMGPAITAALRKQIKESQQEVVDLLYPLIGKMIAKYIRVEIERLSEKIDRQFKNAFSFEVWKRRISAWFSGNKESDMVLRDAIAPEIHDVFMVSKGSGILLGNFSKRSTMDKDMVAGMLTAIKSFAEDAFKKESSELEMIEYESFKIKLFNAGSFYIAVTITGILNAEFNSKLQNLINEFVDLKLRKEKKDVKGDYDFSIDLQTFFNGDKI